MTWGGKQGFQSPREEWETFVVPPHAQFQDSTRAGAGVMGRTREERGLTFFALDTGGHMSKFCYSVFPIAFSLLDLGS